MCIRDRVQREENGKKTLHQVNLNSGYDLYASPCLLYTSYINKKSVLVRQATAYDPNPDIANEQEEAFMKAMRNDDFSIPFWNLSLIHI